MSCSVFVFLAGDSKVMTSSLNGEFHIHVWIFCSSGKVGLLWRGWTCLPMWQLVCSSPPTPLLAWLPEVALI